MSTIPWLTWPRLITGAFALAGVVATGTYALTHLAYENSNKAYETRIDGLNAKIKEQAATIEQGEKQLAAARRFQKTPIQQKELLIAGTVNRGDGVPADGIIVGILPAQYMAATTSSGRYEIRIPQGAPSYTAIAYYRNGADRDYWVDAVSFDPASNQGRFDYMFPRR